MNLFVPALIEEIQQVEGSEVVVETTDSFTNVFSPDGGRNLMEMSAQIDADILPFSKVEYSATTMETSIHRSPDHESSIIRLLDEIFSDGE